MRPIKRHMVQHSDLRRGLITGVIDGFARVALGPLGEPWDFPMNILPTDVEVGSELEVTFTHGRPDSTHPITASTQRDAEVGRRLDRLDRIAKLTGRAVGE